MFGAIELRHDGPQSRRPVQIPVQVRLQKPDADEPQMIAERRLRPKSAMLGHFLRRGRWYATRLAAMPAAEIPHRIAEVCRRMAWRRQITGWRAFDEVGDGALADLAALRARLARAAALDIGQRWIDSIHWTCAGRFSFLGEDWPSVAVQRGETLQVPPTFWFHDPISGKAWPDASTSSFDIDVRSTGTTLGDVKYVWEPNRLQMLHPLAVAIAGTRDRQARDTAFAIIRSWAEANPPSRGVNWKSGIELALRLVGLTLIVAAAAPSTLRSEERAIIRRMIVAHAQYLTAFPSLYSSANNHRVAEGLGLFLAGALLPDLDKVRGWHDAGRSILQAEAMRQILADGVGAEQSPTYQAFTMEMLALAAQLANDLGTPLDTSVMDRLVRGAQFLAWLADADGFVPRIGDDDEGRVLAQPPDREPRYVASVVAAVAGLAKRDDLVPPVHDAHLRDVIFDSPRVSSDQRLGLAIFAHGGMSVINDVIAGRRVHLVFDHGPLGLGPLAAHGHSDALAIWLTVDDEPVFIDAGTYGYFSGGEIRTWLRESLAHNTLSIEDLSQSRVGTPFSWLTATNAQFLAADHEPEWRVDGAHDGYCKRFGVRHIRRISRTRAAVVIEDRLTGGTRSLAAALRFLCHPKVEIAINSNNITISGQHGPLCRIVPPSGFHACIADSLHSECFGRVAAIRQLVLEGELFEEPAVTQIEFVDPRAARAKALQHAGVVSCADPAE
jgi:uncharacterized heparinase superfamily protein